MGFFSGNEQLVYYQSSFDLDYLPIQDSFVVQGTPWTFPSHFRHKEISKANSIRSVKKSIKKTHNWWNAARNVSVIKAALNYTEM